MRYRHDARPPDGTRLYAIGDMHGRLDLLAGLEDKIRIDAENSGAANRIAVFLGDYIDRGPESRELVDYLMRRPFNGFEHVFLIGNHEDEMMRFLDGSQEPANWFANGGVQTLESYGIAAHGFPSPDEAEDWRRQLRRALPPDHLSFYSDLKYSFECGNYLFVHAGVRPGVPIELQDRHDLIWIREAFLGSDQDFGRFVVHGHSIERTPQIKSNRICVDTGAYRSDHLTCAVLDQDEVWFLQT